MSLTTPQTVPKLQKALHAKAKDSPSFRFHRLYDKLSRADVPAHAYACCGAHKGVDGQTFANIETYGRGAWLGELLPPGSCPQGVPRRGRPRGVAAPPVAVREA